MEKVNKKYKIKGSKSDYVYYIISGIILFILAIIVIYPIYFIIIGSISDPDAVLNGEVYLYPIRATIDGYKKLLNEPLIWSGYRNTIIYTVLGTLFNIILTVPAGWALSRETLPFRKLFMVIMIITMFFGGGLIAYYLV